MLIYLNSYYAKNILFFFVVLINLFFFMTVRDLITELSKLDLDRSIWVFYDGGYYVFPPVPDRLAVSDDVRMCDDVSVGDYIIDAG